MPTHAQASAITVAQLNVLLAKAAGNPALVYNTLLGKGYGYAGLALGVAKANSVFGQVAIDYAIDAAKKQGHILTSSELNQIKGQLASAYIVALRDNAINGVVNEDVSFDQAYNFHQQVFSYHGLSEDTWTLTIPYKSLGEGYMDKAWLSLTSLSPVVNDVAATRLLSNMYADYYSVFSNRQNQDSFWISEVIINGAKNAGSDAFKSVIDSLGKAAIDGAKYGVSPIGISWTVDSYSSGQITLTPKLNAFDAYLIELRRDADIMAEERIPLASTIVGSNPGNVSDPGLAAANASARSGLVDQWATFISQHFDEVPFNLPISPASSDAIQPDGSSISFGDVAQAFGSTLGRLLGGSNLLIGTASGVIIDAVAMSVGQQLFHGVYAPNPATPGGASWGTGSVLNDFGNNLQYLATNAAIGSVSSYLTSELAQSLGLNGFASQLFSFVTGNVLQYELLQITAQSGIVGNLLDGAAEQTLGDTFTANIGGFIGTELASLIVTPHTVAESTLASVVSAVGTILGAKGSIVGFGIGGPVGAAIGAFIGFIIGDLIGSLFGHHKPRVPTASAETVLQIPLARYALGLETSANGGDLALADAMAKAARDTLNGIIAQITGGQTPSYVSNTYSPTQVYGVNGQQIYVKLGGTWAGQTNVASADQAVDQGVLWALPQTQIVGGDIYLKRALHNGQWQSVTALLGDLQIASDYEQYIKNEPVIDAAIASSWNSLAQGDKDFYSANKAFMTRAISMTQLPLQGGDVGFYQANQAQVDRIISQISVSSFAAGWIVTLARAAELRLGDYSPSDFYGGLQGFLNSFGVQSTGTAQHFENFTIAMRDDGSASIGAKGAASSGIFSILPDHLDSAPGNDVYNPRFQDGSTGWWFATNTGSGYDYGTNMPGWSGSGNDVIVSVMHGSPNGVVGDWHSQLISAQAGHLYEASVYAAQHRGVAQMYMGFFDSNRNVISYQLIGSGGTESGSGNGNLNNYTLFSDMGLAPAGTAYRELLLRNYGYGNNEPYAFFTRPESHDVTTAVDLQNPRFLDRIQNWHLATWDAPGASMGINFPGWSGSGNDSLYVNIPGATAGDSLADVRSEWLGAQAGQNYNVSVLAAQHRGYVQVWVEWFDANRNWITSTNVAGAGRDYGGAAGDPANYNRIAGVVTAPTGAAYRDLLLRTGGGGGSDAFGFFEQPVFDAVASGGAQNWSSAGADYQAGGNANWDAAGETARIANFGAAVGYNTSGSLSSGNDLINAANWTTDFGVDDDFAGQEGGDDIFLTGSGNDALYGRSGNDWLDAGAGNDYLFGGTGNDVLLGQAGDDYLEGDEGDDYLAGGDGNDTLDGGSGSDVLVGGSGSDTLRGGAGDDTLIVDQDSGGTYDQLDGGDGSDTSSFERFTTGVTVNISGQVNGNQAATINPGAYLYIGQSWWSPDNRYQLVFQGDRNLVLYGPQGAVWATSTNGPDAGFAVMQGDGNLVVYTSNGSPVWASNTAGTANATLRIDDTGLLTINDAYGNVVWAIGGGGSVGPATSWIYGDQWVSIENITGSNYNDNLTGTNYGSTLKGLAGDDVLNGGAGDDTLEGGAGADQLNGGGGSNAASYAASSAGVYVNLATGTAIGGDATGDAFSNIQNLTGSASGDELAGDDNANVIKAGAGDDWLDASFGADTLDGGDGFDTADYSAMPLVSGTQEVWYDDGYGNYYSYETTDPALAITLTNTSGYATLRGGDGSKVTQTITSIEQVIGTSSDDSFSSAGTSNNVTWDGGTGNDAFSGGSGSDTYVFGHNYGTYTISDSNAASNVLKFKSDVTFDDLWAYNDNGTLRVGLRGEGGSVNVYSDFQGTNDVIKTIDLGGAAQVDLTQLQGGNILGDGDDYWVGNANISSIIFGNNGNDTILAAGNNYSTKSFIVDGGLGNDYISSSVGDDQFLFERGDGSDTIDDAGGDNTIVFGPTVGADDVIYEVNGNDLYVGIKDLNNAGLTASQVSDHIRVINGGIQYTRTSDGGTFWATKFSVQAGGATTDLTKANIAWNQQTYYDGDGGGGYWDPVVLDLDGTGLQVTPVTQSSFVTTDAAGNVLRTSWVGPTNGILAFDRNGDGSISNTRDLSFVSDQAGAKTDLEGLAGWDSNGDGTLDAKDANFSKLLVWVDANQDGVAETGEVRTLADAGIASIALTPKPTGFDGSDTLDTVVHNTTTFTRTDGSTGTGYDVGFARQLLSGPAALPQMQVGQNTVARASSDSIVNEAAGATLGKLVNDPFVPSQVAAKGAIGVMLDASALASLNASVVVSSTASDTPISADDAARWADYLDPARIQAVKDALAGASRGGADFGAIRATKARPDGDVALTGRGVRDAVTRLQAVIVDFDQNGPDLIAPGASQALVDVSHSGSVAQIGWVGAGNGILAYDRNGNGSVDPSTEISFLADQPNARNGFQGLAAFDTDHDGALTTADASFANFLVWRDLNGNGVSEAGEVQTLAQAGITELDLGQAASRSGFGSAAANEVLGVSKVVFADGSTRATYDVALGYADQAANDASSPAALPSKPTQPDVPAADPVTSTASPSRNLQAGASPSTDLGAAPGGVGLSRGSLDGPDGLIVTADTASQSGSLEWWRDPAIIGGTLAGLAGPQLTQASNLSAAHLGAAGTGSTDAATLQRLMLLRQSMATLDSAGAVPAAVWNRDVAGDASVLAASARIRLTQTASPLSRAA